MKVRIKFSKLGPMKFIGHLDTMRYFQKALRRAALPVAFSAGFSPHMIMSFAAPLGVGVESLGEYFDVELREEVPSDVIVSRLNREMADGFRVLCAVQVPEGKAGNAMALVAAADYAVRFRHQDTFADMNDEMLGRRIRAFLAQEEVLITKPGKNGERAVNIRPYIYEMRLVTDENQEPGARTFFLKLASASANYTKPEQAMDAFCAFVGQELAPLALQIMRLEVYAEKKEPDSADRPENTLPAFVPLEALGTPILLSGGAYA